MLVSEMVSVFSKEHERTPVVTLNQVELTHDGLVIGRDDPITWDQQAIGVMGKFLGIKPSYLEKCPPDLQAANVNYFLGVHGQEEVMIHLMNDELRHIHSPDKKIVPAVRVAEVIANTFEPDDEVVRAEYDFEKLQLDVISNTNSIVVPGRNTPLRPENDITHGGIRLLATPGEAKAPTISSYLHRRICQNGLFINEEEFSIKLRGHTVPELLDELEANAKKLMANMPARLDAYRASAEIPIEGNLEAFIYNLSRESGLGIRVMDAVMGRINELPTEPTAYDISQMMSAIANESVKYKTGLTLQNIGGSLSMNTDEVLHRCSNCMKSL